MPFISPVGFLWLIEKGAGKDARASAKPRFHPVRTGAPVEAIPPHAFPVSKYRKARTVHTGG
jgi:hypothetical protein